MTKSEAISSALEIEEICTGEFACDLVRGGIEEQQQAVQSERRKEWTIIGIQQCNFGAFIQWYRISR